MRARTAIACTLVLVGALLAWALGGEDDPPSTSRSPDEDVPRSGATLLGSGTPRPPGSAPPAPAPPSAPAATAEGTPAPRPEGFKRVRVRVVGDQEGSAPLEGVPIYAGEAPGGARGSHTAAPLGWTDVEGYAVFDIAAHEQLVSAGLPPPWLPHADVWLKPGSVATIVARRARVVRGIVHGLSAEALAGIRIVARWGSPRGANGDLQRLLFAACDHAGRFSLQVPVEAGKGNVFALPAAEARQPYRQVYAVASLPASPEEEAVLDFRNPMTIAGAVVTESGEPVTSARVDVAPLDHLRLVSTSAAADPKTGRFTFEGLPPGRYELRAYPTDLRWGFSAPIKVHAGSAALTVAVPDAGPVGGEVAGFSGGPNARAEWWRREGPDGPWHLQQAVRVSPEGSFYFARVSGGLTELRIMDGVRRVASARGLRVPDEGVWLTPQTEKTSK